MSEHDRAELKESAKKYVRELYTKHREDDVEAWDNLIEILWLYIDAQIDLHCKDKHHE